MTGDGPGHNGAAGTPAVGPLAVEAALLLDVVADRLAAMKPGRPDPAGDDGTGAGAAADRSAGNGQAGPAPGGRPLGPDGRCPECGAVPGASCTACPLCRFLAMLRGERPETTAKLVDGALLIVRALRSMIPEAPEPAVPGAGASAGSDGPPPPPPARHGFERIDIL